MERIVVGVDGSEPSERALRWAVDEARRRGAALEVVHAWQPPFVGGYPYTAPVFYPGEIETAARSTVDGMLERVDASGVTVERTVLEATASRALLDASKDAALLVVGSRGRGGFTGLLLGSTSQQVCHHATCPVVVIPADEG